MIRAKYHDKATKLIDELRKEVKTALIKDLKEAGIDIKTVFYLDEIKYVGTTTNEEEGKKSLVYTTKLGVRKGRIAKAKAHKLTKENVGLNELIQLIDIIVPLKKDQEKYFVL